MEGEAQQQHPPLLSFNTTTTTNPHLTTNYLQDSLLSEAPPRAPPTHHHYNLAPLDQEPLPLDIDWVTLLSGYTGDPTASVAGKGGGSEGNVSVGSRSGGRKGRGCGGGGGGKSTKKSGVAQTQRVAFHTRSVEDVLDDGYKWRKYGQKAVKNTNHPRSYYRCTYHTCSVKKQIQRLTKDTSVVATTYEGVHNHPSEKLMETLSPLLKQLHFLAKF